MTRRKLKRLYRAAERAYGNGYHQRYTVTAVPEPGPLRLAYDAGVKDAESIPKGKYSPTIDHGPQYPSMCQYLPLGVWMRVLAEETRRGLY